MPDATETVEIEDSVDRIYDYACEQGWTDGLPVVPPTVERVQAMMAAADARPQDVVGALPPRRAEATIEKLAVNAVMAGCKPEYFPVVVAAIEALAEPNFNIYACNTTTNPVAPMLVVNGPIRQKLGINCSWSVMGPGNRANATIGRAVSLAMINIAGRIPGEVTKSTHAQPGRFTWCIGEYEERTPWSPLHVERGFKKEQSTVTVLGPTGSINVLDMLSTTPEEILISMAYSMLVVGCNDIFPGYGEGSIGILFCPTHAELVAQQYSKEQVRQYLLEHTSRIPRHFFPKHLWDAISNQGRGQVHGDYARLAERAEQFVIMVAGGHGGYHSVALHSFGAPKAVTKAIREKGS